jgi:hypothetical protein
MVKECFAMNVLLVLLVSGLCFGEAEVGQWEVFELELTAEKEMENPYLEGLGEGEQGYVRAEFVCKSGSAEGKRLTITGFWDGGKNWKVRFAPPAAGQWSYRVESGDTGLDGKEGTLTCSEWTEEQKQANPVRRGFLRVCRSGPRAGRYFEYADGTPFFWLGDTWWNWTKREISMASFQKLADDRAEKGFNVGQLFFAGRGWGRSSSLLDRGCNELDVEHFRRVEKMIEYANGKGITVWIHGWWSRRGMNESIGVEKVRRWQRYLVHRLCAYNVIWVLAGEYNMDNYGGMGLDFWKDLGRLVEREDPYGRIVSAHPTPPGWRGGAEAPQWDTGEVMHKEPWLDYNQSQLGHGRWRNEMAGEVVKRAYRREPAKPIVITEPWYEFIVGNPTAADVRACAWIAVMSGAAGHSYGGGHVWKAHLPESRAGRDSWPMEMGFETNTLDYPGAVSLGFMAKIMRGLQWWRLDPHPELVRDNPSGYCLAKGGREYVVYLRWGGVVKIDLRPSAEEDTFEYQWIDLAENMYRNKGEVKGGGEREFNPPEDYPGKAECKDWVLLVKKN